MNAFDVVNYFRGGEERGKARKRKGKGKRKQTKPNSSQTSNQSNSVLKKTIIMTSIVEVSLAVSKRAVRLSVSKFNLFLHVSQLFPKSRKLAYDSRQQLSQVQNGLICPSELFLSLDELSRYVYMCSLSFHFHVVANQLC